MRAMLSLVLATALRAQTAVTPSIETFQARFTEAYDLYQAGQFDQAAAELVHLEQEQPKSFDVHELLGLVYAAGKMDDLAATEMRTAINLEPKSASARNNLATTLVRLGDLAKAEDEFRAVLAMEPEDFNANRNLARLYLHEGKLNEAFPLLETVQRIRPEALDNKYDLALAELMTGRIAEARAGAEALLQQKNAGEFHALLAQVNEKQGRYVEAVTEFSTAAHLEPSEDNLFAWANELMSHRAYEAAIAVFREGTRRYQDSARLWVGLGMALYSRGDYEPSIEALLKATDLNAKDARAYVFLSKAYLSSPSQAEAVIERFRRYAELEPGDALAQFDYAMSLWKGRRVNTPDVDYQAVERLMQRSLALDDRNAEVHLQYGILLNDQRKYPEAQREFERAVMLDPELADAHFRLGRAYLKSGEKARAEAELDLFRTLQAKHQAAVDKERAEVRQFVVATSGKESQATPSVTSP